MYYDSISELSNRIHAQKLAPGEAVEACLKRIDALNPKLDAFITVLGIEARDQAKSAKAEIKAGQWRGPLHGIPVAVKDFYDTAGIRTTAGFEQFKDRVPDTDAEAVTKLKQAGAIILGKTNMDSLDMATTEMSTLAVLATDDPGIEFVDSADEPEWRKPACHRIRFKK